MHYYYHLVSYRSLMMTMKMFIARILLIDMQLDQRIVRICALHSLPLITCIGKEMEILLEEMTINLWKNLMEMFQMILMMCQTQM